MNKTQFIAALAENTELTNEQCATVNDVLESHFVFRKKNRPLIAEEVAARLALPPEQAAEVVDAALSLIGSQTKNRLRHPFGKQDRD